MVYDAARSRVVLFGGYDWINLVDGTWEFDGYSWVQGPAAPAALGRRGYHALAYDAARRKTVLFGGWKGGSVYENDTWEYDGVAWTTGPLAPAALGVRAGAASAFDDPRSCVVLFGGVDAGGWELADTWEYDGSAWTQGPDCPVARGGHAMAFDAARGRMVAVGGYNGGSPAGDVWEYDGVTWAPAVSPPAGYQGRMGAAMAFHAPSNAVLVTAGLSLNGDLRDAWLYDGSTWNQAADLPGGRRDHGLAYHAGGGRAVCFGGEATGETVQFDGAAWTVAPVRLSPIEDHAMVYDSGRHRTITCTGRDALGAGFGETWELGATGWTLSSMSGAPLWYRSGLAYDAARGRTVLFGGEGQPGETWEFDGTAWTRRTVGPPAARGWEGHSMAYDPARQRVVIFGGMDGFAYTRDTWEYDGTSWTPGGAAPAALLPRMNAAMAHVPACRCLVLFGGADRTTVLGDTWEYDGAWTVGAPSPPGLTPRYRAAMATEEARGVAVLYGGRPSRNTPTVYNETWEYGAGGWRQGATPPAAMAMRTGTAMAYSEAYAGIVLFGGRDATTSWILEDVWVYRDPTAPPPPSPDVVVGQGLGLPNPNRVRVYTAQGAATPVDFLAYAAGAWGANVASADINGVSREEIVTGAGPGSVHGPQVRAFLSSGSPVAKVNFYAYGTLRHGVNVGVTSIDGDANAELLSAPGPGAVFGPHVRGFDYDGVAVAVIAKVSFFAFGTLRYGANVAGGDVDADGYGELLCGPGAGPTFAAQARGFDYDGASLTPIAKINFSPFNLGHGLALSAGDLDADGYAELATAPGPGPANPARVLGFEYDAARVSALPGADITPFATAYGAATAIDAFLPDTAGREELVAGAGRDPSATSLVAPYRYLTALFPVGATFVPFPGGYGVNVALGRLGY